MFKNFFNKNNNQNNQETDKKKEVANSNTQNSDLSQKDEQIKLPQELQVELQSLGNKLGFLISSSTIPEDAKLELIALLPKMSLEQLDRLLNIFEAKFLNDQTQEIDKVFQEKIKKISQEHKDQEEKLKQKFHQKITGFEEKLKQIKQIEK
jgi:hypothetical protein